MSDKLTWTNEQRRLGDLIPWPRNPRQIKRDEARRLVESLEQFAQVDTIAIGPGNVIYNGHQRLNVWLDKWGPDLVVDVRVASRPLTEKEREKLTVYLHRGTVGEFDFDILANEFELPELLEWGFEDWELGIVESGPPSLDDLADEYGEPGEQDFWPVIKVQVSPETYALYDSLMQQTGIEDEGQAMGQILSAVDASVLGSVLP